MTSRYQLSQNAAAEIDQILDYLAEQSEDAAFRVGSALIEAFELLAEQPGIGHWRRDLTDATYKFWSVFSYYVVYDPSSSPLMIISVVHGARDVRRLLTDL